MAKKKRKARRTPAQKAVTKRMIAANRKKAHSPTKKRRRTVHVRRATGSWRVMGSPTKKRKKARTAKQKAATKRMIAANRKKHGKKAHSPTRRRRTVHVRRATHPWRVMGSPTRKRKAPRSAAQKAATKRMIAANRRTRHDWPGEPKKHAAASRRGWRKVAKPGWKPKKRAKKAHSPTRPRHATHGHRHSFGSRGMSYRKALAALRR